MAPDNARYALRMDAADEQLIAKAAALVGVTTADFILAAATEKARELLGNTRHSLSERDFALLVAALGKPFSPNAALASTLDRVRLGVRNS